MSQSGKWYEGYRDVGMGRNGSENTYSSLPTAQLRMAPMEVLSGTEYGRETQHHGETTVVARPWSLFGCVGLFVFLVVSATPHHNGNFKISKLQRNSTTSLNGTMAPHSSCGFPSTIQSDANHFSYLNSSNLCHQDVVHCSCRNPVVPARPASNLAFPNPAAWNHTLQLNVGLVRQAIAGQIPLDVVILGDSIAEMCNDRFLGHFGGGYDTNSVGYKTNAIVFQKLFHKKNGSKVEGLALGIAGDQTQNLLYRLQNGEMPPELRPKVWWILIGTNNLGIGACDADAITAGNIRIVEELQKHSPETPIVINSILPRGPEEILHHNPNWKILQTANHQLECYANARDNVYFFNATSLFLYSTGRAVYVNATLMPDYLHPSGNGVLKWGTGIVEKVLQLTGRPDNESDVFVDEIPASSSATPRAPVTLAGWILLVFTFSIIIVSL